MLFVSNSGIPTICSLQLFLEANVLRTYTLLFYLSMFTGLYIVLYFCATPIRVNLSTYPVDRLLLHVTNTSRTSFVHLPPTRAHGEKKSIWNLFVGYKDIPARLLAHFQSEGLGAITD